ncbi:MAG: hypothetical protein HRU32_17365 [Rhodobacteraceae bacterium]|nr:hypothetical protein [Paracoccaceae bacterium]
MKLSKKQFWLAFALLAPLGIWFWVMHGVRISYHPGAAKGDLLNPLRQMAWLGIILTPVIMIAVTKLRPGRASMAYTLGGIVLVVWALLPILPRIDNGYKESTCIEGQRYEIPWQYNPEEIRETCAKNTYFIVRASLPELRPQYAEGDRAVLSKRAAQQRLPNDVHDDLTCVIQNSSWQVCRWSKAGFTYQVEWSERQLPELTPDLQDQIVDLLDSFNVTDS